MKLYLTNADSTQDVTDFIIQVQWSGDEASITRQLRFSILYEENENWPVPMVGNVITLEEEGETLFKAGWSSAPWTARASPWTWCVTTGASI